MVTLEYIQEIVQQIAMEIKQLLQEHPYITAQIQFTDLPVGEFMMAELAMIEVFQKGDDDPIFSYDLTLEVSESGEIYLLCFDVTFRDAVSILNMDEERSRLKELLTVYKLVEVTAERIVVDFFQKMSALESDKFLKNYCKN